MRRSFYVCFALLVGCGSEGALDDPPDTGDGSVAPYDAGSADGGPDARADATSDATSPKDSGNADAKLVEVDAADATTEAAADAPFDAPVDAAHDAPVDAPVDASHDAPADAGHDAGPLDAGPDAAQPLLPCNGATELCGRRFNQVAYPTTHNAMSSSDDGFVGPNQHQSMTGQLEAGIRGMMIDTHYDNNVAYLCHQYCILGKKPLADGLREIKTFLDGHPREVVTIIFESYVSAADTKGAFTSAGLLARTHAHVAGQPWPTLGELIQRDERVVVFTDNGGGTYPWYMDMWVHMFETHYDNKAKSDLDCRPNRGSDHNSLFILNHFLTNPIASEALAIQVNYNSFFIDKAHECQARYNNHLPNFVTVDFFDLGDVFAVTRSLNGL